MNSNELPAAPVAGLINDGDRELQFVLIASGACGACADPMLPDLVRKAKKRVAEQAQEEGLGFATVAVGIDGNLERSRDNVERFGQFHEVSLGRTWLNVGAQKYIWVGHPGPASVPQVVVVERSFAIYGDRIGFPNSRVRARAVGLGELVRWQKADFPLSK